MYGCGPLAVIQGRRMAVTVEPFQPFHIDLLRAQGVQGPQAREVSIVPQGYATLAKPSGPSVTVRDGDHIILCGGIVDIGLKRGTCWALLSQDAGQHMLFLHRAVRRFLTMQHWQRLEATVEENFSAGCKWVELLGFQFEGRMPGYGPDGQTHL